MAVPEIRALALDLGNVLIKVDHLRFCRRLAAIARLSPREVYRRVFESPLEPGFDTGLLSPEEFHQYVQQLFRVKVPYEQFCTWWNDIFAPLEGMAEIVEHLAAFLPLFLVSNTNPLHFEYVRQHYPFLECFQDFILSYQVGSRKPEPGIYQALIRRLQSPPGHCLFVDDKAPFVQAAQEHGLMAWQFLSPRLFLQALQEHGLY